MESTEYRAGLRSPSSVGRTVGSALAFLCLLAAAAGSGGCRGKAPERGWAMLGYDGRGTNFYPIPSEPIKGEWRIREVDCPYLDNVNFQDFELVSDGDHGGAVPVYLRGGYSKCEILVGGDKVLGGSAISIMGQADMDSDGETELAVKKGLFKVLRSSSPESLTAIRNMIVAGFQDTVLATCGPGDSLVAQSEIRFVARDGSVRGTIPSRPYVSRFYEVAGGLMGRPAALVTDESPWFASDFVYQRYFRSVLSAGRGPMYRALSYNFAEGIASRRGVLALDMETGEELWFYHTATFPYLYAVWDVVGDGEPEILLGSYAPQNFVNGGNMTDLGQAQVILLDSYGSPLWIHTIVGTYAGVRTGVARIGSDPKCAVVAAAGNAYADWGILAVLNPADGSVISEREDKFSYTSLVLADLDGDGSDEIITGTSDGRFLVFDRDLSLRHETRPVQRGGYFQITSCFAQCANDIDGDGGIEIIGTWAKMHYEEPSKESIAYSHPDSAIVCVVVLSRDLHVMAESRMAAVQKGVVRPWLQPLTYLARVCDVGGDGINDIVTSIGGRLRIVSPVVVE